MQRVIRMGDEHEAQAHQRLALESGGNAAEDGQVRRALRQRIGVVPEHRFEHLDARLRALLAEAIEAFQQQPGREEDLDRDALEDSFTRVIELRDSLGGG